MRDIFDDFGARPPPEPLAAARKATRATLRRRLYNAATVAADQNRFYILLDETPVRTPARHALVVPNQSLAQEIAAEWQAQREVVDPAHMPLTRLANTIIDAGTKSRPAMLTEIEKFLASDLLCYRAAEPPGLVARQRELWDPVLAWAQAALGARFDLVECVTHTAQPAAAINAAAAAIPRDLWPLGAVHAITTLTGSALIALAIARRAINVDAAWAAAHADEDWNERFWGRDELALQRRVLRLAEMRAAATVLALT